VLGARSALFVPLPKLGLIVVDEEHDPSYKNETTPHYHARETALEKARLHGAVIILGSATPSMESRQQSIDGKLRRINLHQRAVAHPPPRVKIINMVGTHWYLSNPLLEAIQERLNRGEQSLLFLNRRGFATYVLCSACGWEARCPQCEVTLVHHKLTASAGTALDGTSSDELRCHLCSYQIPLPRTCAPCGKETIKIRGRGTQRVCADLQKLFPTARILRWDRDTTSHRRGHADAFQAINSHSVDIVVGTQMIAQGFDFPRVTLAGILDGDRSLRFPDFRAGERTFQLLAQVAGRAGRGDVPGDVFLQTRDPDHYAIRAAAGLDYNAFADEELSFRRDMSYPPYVRVALLLVRSRKTQAAEKAAESLMNHLEGIGFPSDIQILGPAPSFHKKREGFTEWQVMVKAPGARLDDVLSVVRNFPTPKNASLAIDVDPE
jgi:primosomal protein N' (replication factor Y)